MKIGMYMMCRKSSNSSVQAFALDHINDVVVNSVGLFGAGNLFSPRNSMHMHMTLKGAARIFTAFSDLSLRRAHKTTQH